MIFERINITFMEYPHTTINSDLGQLESDLRDASETVSEMADTLRQAADAAEEALGQYNEKKDWYTSRIAELENQANQSNQTSKVAAAQPAKFVPQSVRSMAGYPHTNILSNLDALVDSLEQSSSPAKARRLELARKVRDEYKTKKTFLFNTIEGR